MKKLIALVLVCSGMLSMDGFAAGRGGAVGAAAGGGARGRAPVASAQAAGGASGAGAVKSAAPGATSARAAVSRGRAPAASGASGNAKSVLPPSGGATSTASAGATSKSGGISARAAVTQKAINNGVKITGATANTVVSDECKTKYYGCMDSFCMLDNTNGGRCLCSDRHAELETVLAEIQKLDEQSYAMATSGVERINMGEDADAVNAMVDKVTGSIATKPEEKKTKARTLNLDAWNDDISFEETEVFKDAEAEIANLKGDALHSSVSAMCAKQMPECSEKMSMLKMMYIQQIKGDCGAYENSLKQQKNASAKKLQTAQAALREAALEQHQNANKYDLGQCTVRFKQCMQTTAGCGDDFSKCASIVAGDNAQAKVGTRKKAKTKDYTIQGASSSITIAATTYDTLLAKKPMCESVTKQCVLVKDKVWDTFLHEVAPELKSAELIAESNLRMNCIGNISECFQKACKDNIDPNDPEGSYDMCLSRPETMRSLCKVQIDPCEAAEPKVMDYVYAKLASMRVDSCTKEVKECLTNANRCGENYENCVGLDLAAIREMCPLEKLVGCQKNGQEATWAVIDNIVQGIYLNIDNSMLNQCQKIVSTKMLEICGDDAECDAFNSDKYIGADSLTSYKSSDGSFVIDGLLSFGKVKVKETESTADNVKFGKYELDISDYANNIQDTGEMSAVKQKVLSTLQSTQNKINQKIALLTSDPKISMCVNGRDMKQIRGDRGKNMTDARYPHLLDSSIMAIINAGLAKADSNYSKKYDELLTKAMEEQGDEKRAALCAAMASSGTNNRKGIFGIGHKKDVLSQLMKKQIGVSGTGYELRHVINGMTMDELMSQQKDSKGSYIQTDASGNMVSQIIMVATYSAESNTCKLTTTTQVCENMKDVYDEYNSTTESCGSGGITLLGGSGCSGGGGALFKVGGGGKSTTTVSSSTFRGTVCTKMTAPVTKTEEIKM